MHREAHVRVSDLNELEKDFILLNIFMKLRDKITEDINERNKPYLMLLMAVVYLPLDVQR